METSTNIVGSDRKVSVSAETECSVIFKYSAETEYSVAYPYQNRDLAKS